MRPTVTAGGNSENTQMRYSQRPRTAMSIIALPRHVSDCFFLFCVHMMILMLTLAQQSAIPALRSTIYKYPHPKPLGSLALKVTSHPPKTRGETLIHYQVCHIIYSEISRCI